jgi:hypothetical protein
MPDRFYDGNQAENSEQATADPPRADLIRREHIRSMVAI